MAPNSNFLFLLLLLFNFHLRLSFSDGQFSPLFFFYTTSMLLKLPIFIVFEFWGTSGDSNSMESVPDLQKSMYKVIDGYPCVRLLNLSGPIGCSSKFYLNLSNPEPSIFFAFKSNQIKSNWCILTSLSKISDPGRQVVVAPIVRYQNATQLSQSSSILVSLDEFQSFITRHAFSFIYLFV